jgi:hypothetical protein
MAITKATSSVLADNAALNNLNAGASIAFTKSVSVSGNLAVDTNTLFVDSVNNRVGVGTASPNSPLHVIGSLRVDNGSTAGALNFGADVQATTRSSNVRKLAAIVSPDFANIRTIEWASSDSDNSFRNLVYLGGRVGGSNFAATEVIIATAPTISTNGGTTAIYVDSSQRVGIGTTSLSERLTVAGNISATGTVIASNYNPAANVATFLATPTSANLAAAVSDETGSGALVFANTPTLVTPNIGAATGTSLTVTGNISASGTANSLPNQTLSRDDNTRILTKKTSARDDMWSVWEKRWIQGSTTTTTGGSGFTAAAGTMSYNVTCGTPAIGRTGAFGETGMTVNPGQGASWSIPSSFAVAFGFFGLYTNNVVTSNNITSGSNTFVISAIQQVQVGLRIYSSAFPEETYVSAINGTTITATKNATSTPTTPHTVVFTPDQISRVVLGTSSAITRYELDCPNAQEVFIVTGAKNIGDTILGIFSNITGASVAVMWSGQPYFILTTANASISNSNGTTFYASCRNFPVNVTTNVLRCDNVVGTPVTTTGTWSGTATPTNQITVASATNIVANQTVSGLGIPQNTTVSSIIGTTVTLNQNITTSGSSVTLYFGYQRIFVDQNATASGTGQSCGFLLKSTLNSYIYGRGITSGTTITNITSFDTNVFNLTISNALTKSYTGGVWLSVNSTAATNFTGNNCIFMDFSSDPADGYLKVRLGYMLNGLITYSPWTSFLKGNVPAANYNYYYQAVIDYNAATDKLRLFADRNGDIITNGNPRDIPKAPSTPTITMTGVSGLNDKATNLQFGLQIYGNNVNALANATTARLDVRQLVYYPYQTFID